MNSSEIEMLMKEVGSIGGYIMESNQMFAQLIRKTEYGEFDRADWQCINYLHRHSTVELGILKQFLANFESDQENRTHKIDRFLQQGIIKLEQGIVTLTAFGTIVFDAVYEAQKDILVASFQNINSEEYIITIKVIKQMVYNMQAFIPT